MFEFVLALNMTKVSNSSPLAQEGPQLGSNIPTSPINVELESLRTIQNFSSIFMASFIIGKCLPIWNYFEHD